MKPLQGLEWRLLDPIIQVQKKVVFAGGPFSNFRIRLSPFKRLKEWTLPQDAI